MKGDLPFDYSYCLRASGTGLDRVTPVNPPQTGRSIWFRPASENGNRGSGRSFAAAQLDNAVLAAQSGQHNADHLLRRKLPTGGAWNLLYKLFCLFLLRFGFLSHFALYDGPEIPSSTPPTCLTSADPGQASKKRNDYP
jgi:hypothetical protein